MVARNVLYVETGSQFDNTLINEIHPDWVVHTARDSVSIQSLLGEHDYHVGVARFSDNGEEFLDGRLNELLFSIPHINWIAVLPPSALQQTNVCRLVSECFHDYHQLPVDSRRLNIVLGHAFGKACLKRQVGKHQSGQITGMDDGLIGNSATILTLKRQLDKVTRVDTPLLISGDSGTGKELAARLVHKASQRTCGPFVAVNCAALPSSLIQSELFGYQKGAFTGALKNKVGRIESANTGTLFLDEIGDLPLDMQVTLLRFLDEHSVDQVGGTVPVPVDVRVIAATNIDLEDAVERGKFREDLYYRLKILHLHMPPLCARGQDLESLARYFFQQFEREKNPAVQGFSHSAIQAMYTYSWPGNVRELMNNVRRAMVMSEGPLIVPADLELERRTRERRVQTLEECRNDAEKAAIICAFEFSGNNITRTAECLDISRGTLYRLMEKHGIHWPGKLFEQERPGAETRII